MTGWVDEHYIPHDSGDDTDVVLDVVMAVEIDVYTVRKSDKRRDDGKVRVETVDRQI
jgi:hypothetical protein